MASSLGGSPANHLRLSQGLVCDVPVCDGTGPISRDAKELTAGNRLRLGLGKRTKHGNAELTLPTMRQLGPNHPGTSVSPFISRARRYQISRSNLQGVGKGVEYEFPGSAVRDRAPGCCPSDDGSALRCHEARRARKANWTLSIHCSPRQKKRKTGKRREQEFRAQDVEPKSRSLRRDRDILSA